MSYKILCAVNTYIYVHIGLLFYMLYTFLYIGIFDGLCATNQPIFAF